MFATASVLSLTACAPAFYTYRYISLEQVADIEILSRGKAQVDNLFFHKKMPLRYRLERDTYVLFFNLDTEAYLPVMIVTVEAKNSTELKLAGRILEGVSLCGGGFGPLDATGAVYIPASPDDARSAALEYLWLGCPGEVDPAALVLSFDVLSDIGELLVQELVPFDLKENGFFYVIDGL